MKKDSIDLLLKYLNEIIYEEDQTTLDIENIDEEYLELAKGLQLLSHDISEAKAFAKILADGMLNAELPSENNFLAKHLKTIHANLSHLTLQTTQIVQGDYSQKIFYPSKFSEDFNAIVSQLSEIKNMLHAKTEEATQIEALSDQYNEFFIKLTLGINERIILTAIDDMEKVFFTNQNSCNYPFDNLYQGVFLEESKRQMKLMAEQENPTERVWEFKDYEHNIYQVTMLKLEWHGQDALAHVIRNVTEEREMINFLKQHAYFDQLTGTGNRHYFKEKMTNIIQDKRNFVFCFMDLDGLKQVNDTFGHQEGNNYISNYVDAVRANIRGNDIFARIGGDEFALTLIDCSIENAQEKLRKIVEDFKKNNHKNYPCNFSWGLVDVIGEAQLGLEQLLQIGDKRMYEMKKKHKSAQK